MKRFFPWYGILAVLLLAGFAACGDNGSNPADGDDDQVVTDGDNTDVEAEAEAQCAFARDCGEGNDCRDGMCVATRRCYEGNEQCAKDEICSRPIFLDPEEPGWCLKFCTTDLNCPATGQCMDGVCQPWPGLPAGAPYKTGSEEKQDLKAGLGMAELDFPMGVTMGGYAARHGNESPYAKAMGGMVGISERAYVKALALDTGESAVILVRAPAIFITDYLVTSVVKKIIEARGIDLSDNLLFQATHTHSEIARFWNIFPGGPFGALGLDDFSGEVFDRLATSYANAVMAALDDLKPAAIGYAVNHDFDPNNRLSSDRRGTNNPVQGGGLKDDDMVVIRVDDVSGAQAKPMAAVIRFGAHGTINDWVDTFSTQDTGGGVELMFQKLFEADTGEHIEALFVQGNTGDISPRGDRFDHPNQGKMQLLGNDAYYIARALYDAITTTRDVDMEMVHKRIGVDFDLVGYNDKEFFVYDVVSMGCEAASIDMAQCEQQDAMDMAELGCQTISDEMSEDYCMKACMTESGPYGNMRFGGFQCGIGAPVPEDQDINTRLIPGCMGCFMNIERLNNAPSPEFGKTRISAVKLNDLVILTLPGEPDSSLGIQFQDRVRQAVKDTYSQDVTTTVFGYSQDHRLYLAEESDWLQGGYTANMCIWGPREGQYIVDQGVALAAQLFTPEKEDNTNNIKPLLYEESTIDWSWRVPSVTPEADRGRVTQQPPAIYKPIEQMTFTFLGGDPGVDRPEVVLQKKNGEDFEDVVSAAGRRYDDEYYNIQMFWLNPKINKVGQGERPDENRWTVVFEEYRDLAAGQYRFKLLGHYYTGTGTTFDKTKVASYETHTDSFTVAPSDKLYVHDFTVDTANLTFGGGLSYPASPSNDPGPGVAIEEIKSVTYLLHCDDRQPLIGCRVPMADVTSVTAWVAPAADPDNKTGCDAPQLTDGTMVRGAVVARTLNESSQLVETVSTYDGLAYPATLLSGQLPAGLAAGDWVLTVRFQDKYGNVGQSTKSFTLP